MMRRRSRSAKMAEPCSAVSRMTTTNSSPPYRATRSTDRASRRRISPICRSTESPAMCPRVSFTSLKRSMSASRIVRARLYRPARSSSCSSSWESARRFKQPVSASVAASFSRRFVAETAVSKSYAFSIAATAVRITVSANWASARVSGGSSPVVRRKNTPTCWSFMEKGSATAERVGTVMRSRCQRVRSSAYTGSVATSSTSTARPLAGEQLAHTERLGDEVGGAQAKRFDRRFLGRHRRDHQDRKVAEPLVGLHLGQELEAVHLGHHDVEQQQVGAFLLELPHEPLATGRDDDLVAVLLEDPHERADQRLVVVGDEDLGRGTVGHLLSPREARDRRCRRSRRAPWAAPAGRHRTGAPRSWPRRTARPRYGTAARENVPPRAVRHLRRGPLPRDGRAGGRGARRGCPRR